MQRTSSCSIVCALLRALSLIQCRTCLVQVRLSAAAPEEEIPGSLRGAAPASRSAAATARCAQLPSLANALLPASVAPPRVRSKTPGAGSRRGAPRTSLQYRWVQTWSRAQSAEVTQQLAGLAFLRHLQTASVQRDLQNCTAARSSVKELRVLTTTQRSRTWETSAVVRTLRAVCAVCKWRDWTGRTVDNVRRTIAEYVSLEMVAQLAAEGRC